MKTESLDATEAECAEGRTAPRVSLADIEANIDLLLFFTAGEALHLLHRYAGPQESFQSTFRYREPADIEASLNTVTICILTTRNGFTIIGKSAPASAENFDAELGRKLAYEDAVRQLWPLMGYALREQLAGV